MDTPNSAASDLGSLETRRCGAAPGPPRRTSSSDALVDGYVALSAVSEN